MTVNIGEVERNINAVIAEHAETIFRGLDQDYDRIYGKVNRIRSDIMAVLEDYENKDGSISKTRIRTLLRELDEIAPEVYRELTDELEKEITETTKKANKVIVGALIATLGISLAFGSRSNKPSEQDAVDDVMDYVINRRGKDGISLNGRIEAYSGLLLGEIQKSIRYGVIRGETTHRINRRVRESFDRLSWHIKRLVMTEIPLAYRKLIVYVGDQTGILKAVRIVDYRGRHANHERHECYRLAEQDKYGMGKGVYLPTDTYIFDPHPQCTAYFEYIFKADVEREG